MITDETAAKGIAQGLSPELIAFARQGVTTTVSSDVDDPFDPENWADPDAAYAIWTDK